MRSILARATTAFALAMTLVLTGCASASPAPSASGPSSATTGGVLGTVSSRFGHVSVPKPADGQLTVVALGWSDAEMALALDVVPVAVEDWQGFGAANKGVGSWATARFGGVTPKLIARADNALNYEEIQALDPDVILNVRSSNDEKEYQRLSQIAPTIAAPGDTGAFGVSWDAQLQQVGDALGKGDVAKKLIADTKADIAAAAAAHPQFKGKTAVAATKFGDAYGAYLAGDGRLDLLTDLGFVQNPPVLKLTANGFYAAVSAEQVSVLDADVAVVLPIGFTKAQVQADPLLSSLNVVKQGRAVILDADDKLSGAYSAASVLSLKVVLDELVPQLDAAVAKS